LSPTNKVSFALTNPAGHWLLVTGCRRSGHWVILGHGHIHWPTPRTVRNEKKSDSGCLSKNLQGSEPKQQKQGSLNEEPLFWVQCEKCEKVRAQVRCAMSHGVNFCSLLKQNATLLCLFFILTQWRVLVGEDSNIVINGKWFCHVNEDPLNNSCKPREKDKLWCEGHIAGFFVSGFSPARPFW